MTSPISKIMDLIDRLPEEDRMIIAKSYYVKDEKDMSPKVIKLKKVYDKLSEEEQQEFITHCWARMINPTSGWVMALWVEAIEVSEEEEPEEDLSE